MRRSAKITAFIAAVVTLIFGTFAIGSNAMAKSSPKAENLKAIQKVLPYGMPQAAKQAITTTATDPSLPVNEYIQYYTDYMTGEQMLTTYVFSPTAEDPYRWAECTANCSRLTIVKKGKGFILSSKLLSNETVVFGSYSFAKGDLYVGSSWNGSSLPMKSTVKWMGKQTAVVMQFAMVGVYNSAHPVPDYGYPAGV